MSWAFLQVLACCLNTDNAISKKDGLCCWVVLVFCFVLFFCCVFVLFTSPFISYTERLRNSKANK